MLTMPVHCVYQRLQDRYNTAPDKYPTLQSIVDSEIADGTNKGSKSCTVGLLWLKRYTILVLCPYSGCGYSAKEDNLTSVFSMPMCPLCNGKYCTMYVYTMLQGPGVHLCVSGSCCGGRRGLSELCSQGLR